MKKKLRKSSRPRKGKFAIGPLKSRSPLQWAMLVFVGVVLYKLGSIIALDTLALFRSDEQTGAIFVLGGSYYVERYAAEMASQRAEIPVIVSSGRDRPCSYKIFVDEGGVEWPRVTLDYRATDTFSNFTSGLEILRDLGVKNVQIVAQEAHWPRASALARLIFSTHGIAFQPALIAGGADDETREKLVLDSLRAGIWRITGGWIPSPTYASEPQMFNQQTMVEASCQSGLRGFIPENTREDYGPKMPKEQQLLRAIDMGDQNLVGVLLQAGISANAQKDNGVSALQLAIAGEREDLVKLLVEAGASLNQLDERGKYPLDYLPEGSDLLERLGPELRQKMRDSFLRTES